MRHLIFIIIIAMFLGLGGCATQGRLTYLTFENSFNYKTLDSSMEKLKRQGYDGSIQQKMSALREVRYISKHMGDPGKREMALRTLVFLAFASEDGDVRDRSMTRLEDVLENEEWPTYLRYVAIDSTLDLVSGELGYQEEYDGMMMHFGVETDTREDALDFILDYFDELSPDTQFYTINAIHNFLLTPPTLDNCPYDICDENVRKNLEAWETGKEVKRVVPDNADPLAVEAGAYGPESKIVPISERIDWNEEMDDLKEITWKWMGDPLEMQNISLTLRGRLIRLAGEIENFSLQEEMVKTFIEVSNEWSEEEDIAADLRQLLAASREKVKLYGYPASKPPLPSESSFSEMSQRQLEFIETHLDAILRQQKERQQRGFQIGTAVLADIIFSSYEETEEAQLKKAILFDIGTKAMESGLNIKTKNLAPRLLEMIETATSESELRTIVKFAANLYPSYKSNRKNPNALMDVLVAQALSSETLIKKKLFINAILKGFDTFPEETNIALSQITDLDVVTQHQIQTRLQSSEGTL